MPEKAPIDWARFVEFIRGHRRFALVTHVRPDCDALGSELAMASTLRRLGKEAVVCNAFGVPANLRFLDPHGWLTQWGVDISQAGLDACDAILVLDTSAWAQLGDMVEPIRRSRADKAVLDHHLSGDDLGAERFKDIDAEATGRLVAEAMEQLGVPLDAESAQWLLAALTTDTGWFRFASTTADTLRLGARLVDAGASPDRLYRDLYEHDSLGRMQLVGRALGRTKSEMNGRLIHSWIEQADFRELTGAAAQDTEDVINLTLAADGTQVAVMLVELACGQFKVSFRSRNDLDCAKLAETFGGGGHLHAAGATVPGPLDAARTRILDAVRKAMVAE